VQTRINCQKNKLINKLIGYPAKLIVVSWGGMRRNKAKISPFFLFESFRGWYKFWEHNCW